MIGNVFCRQRVLFHQGRRERQRLAGVVEALLIRRVYGEFAGGAQIHAGQVANRVVVLRIAQAPRQHRAGIACVPGGLRLLRGPNPRDQRVPLFIRRLFGKIRGRHLFRGNSLRNQRPMGIIPRHRRCAVEIRQVQLRLWVVLAVTGKAVSLHEGPDGTGKLPLQFRFAFVRRSGIGRARPTQNSQKREKGSGNAAIVKIQLEIAAHGLRDPLNSWMQRRHSRFFCECHPVLLPHPTPL